MFMGAVDVCNQFRSYIKLELRSGKYWHPMMWFILESALVNAWVLYKATREAAGLAPEFTHLEFCISIALALVAAEWEAMGCVNRAGLLNSPSTEVLPKLLKRPEKLYQHGKTTLLVIEPRYFGHHQDSHKQLDTTAGQEPPCPYGQLLHLH